MRLLYPLLLASQVLVAGQALAWGPKAHRAVAEAAAEALPGTVGEALRARLPLVLAVCSRPDSWRRASDVSLFGEGPDHYVNLEVIARNPAKAEFPPDRYALLLSVRRPGQAVGFLPYAIAEGYDRLSTALAAAGAGEDAAWDEVAVWFGVLSHFVADATMPLHATVHYDGRPRWGRLGGPIECKGIHERLEDSVAERLAGSTALLSPGAVPTPVGDPLALAVCLVKESWALVPEVYELDAAGRLRPDEPAAARLVGERLGLAAGVLLDLVGAATPLGAAAEGFAVDVER